MKVLLTGSSGMVGRNILDHESFNNLHEIISPNRDELDLMNYDFVFKFFQECMPDLVIHAAGTVGGIQANIKKPVDFLVQNFDIGKNVVLASRQVGINKLINLGSSCMYPRNRQEPLKECDVLTGELESTNEAYAIAKISISRLCEYIYKESNEFCFKTLIPPNLYGKYDKFDPKYSHLIPAIIHKMHQAKINHLDSVEVWGDGKARREFMYVKDLVDIIVKCVDNYDMLPIKMNVGLGKDYTVNEYYKCAAEVIQYHGKLINNIEKPVGMNRKLLNNDTQIEIGWPALTSLKEGIQDTYDYYLTTLK